MTSLAKIAGVALFTSLAIAHGAAPSRAGEGASFSLRPFHGLLLTVGSKRAVGYYVAGDNACNLTLMLADTYTDGQPSASEPVRVNLTVREGTSARVDALEGSLAFQCASGATAMTVQPIERIAYTSVAK